MPSRIHLSMAAANDSDGYGCNVKRTSMRGTIKADGQTTDETEPSAPHVRCKSTRKLAAACRFTTASDDSYVDRYCKHIGRAEYEQRNWWILYGCEQLRVVGVRKSDCAKIQLFD